MPATPWKPAGEGVDVHLRVTPRGGRDAIDGIAARDDGGCVLKVRVRAAPEGGEANDAVRRLVAKAAGLPPSAARIVAGHTARLKTCRLDGDAGAIAARLAAAVATDEPSGERD